MAPQVLHHPGARPTERIGTLAVDTRESSAPYAYPSTDEHDDTVEAHYSSLERLRPHACCEGVVYIGHLVVADGGEEVERVEALPCRRCAERS